MSTTEQQQQFNHSLIGQFGEDRTSEVTRAETIAYANATNDTLAAHVEGTLAPPVYVVRPSFPALGAAIGPVVPPEVVMAIVHSSQDFRFHRPIEPGMTLVSRAKPIGIQKRRSGIAVVTVGETRAGDELLVEQFMTSIARGAVNDADHGEGPPDHRLPDTLRTASPVAEISQQIDMNQTYRYAEASGDHMPIHVDDDFAKSVGLPGIIVHGLCTMAFISHAVISHACPEDPSRLRRLAVRFAGFVLPGQTITTRLYDAGPGRFAFETTSDTDVIVIKDGLAEVAG